LPCAGGIDILGPSLSLTNYENICFVFDHRAGADRPFPGLPDPEERASDHHHRIHNSPWDDEHGYRQENKDYFIRAGEEEYDQEGSGIAFS